MNLEVHKNHFCTNSYTLATDAVCTMLFSSLTPNATFLVLNNWSILVRFFN